MCLCGSVDTARSGLDFEALWRSFLSWREGLVDARLRTGKQAYIDTFRGMRKHRITGKQTIDTHIFVDYKCMYMFTYIYTPPPHTKKYISVFIN